MIYAKRCGKGGKNLLSKGGNRCPDVFELENGDFLVIGQEVVDLNIYNLPDDASCDENESAVILPREVFLSAIGDIKNE